MPIKPVYDKELTDVICVDCGREYKKNKYVVAQNIKAGKEQRCRSCHMIRLNRKMKEKNNG